MKKIVSLLLGLVMTGNFIACSDDDYTEKFNDPSKTNTVSCEKLMTGIFFTGATFTYNSYWRMYTWENMSLGVYAQTIGFTNSEGNRYSVADSYANDRWQHFYNTLTQFRLLQDTYNNLSDDEKKVHRLFYCLSEVFVYDHLSQVIDAFGDVPFEQAGYLALTGDVKESYPSYDNASALYAMMLDNLGSLYTEIQSISTNIPSQTAAYLTSQDFINRGNLTKWMKYCVSLRLRLAMRVATQGDLAAKGQSVIQEILNSNHPLVNGLAENIQVLSDDSDRSSTADPAGLNYGDGFRDGYKDHANASQTMLDAMLTEETLGMNDPRLQVMYSRNAKGEYKGLSTRDRFADQQAALAQGLTEDRAYSRIDSTTIIFNRNLKSPIITASEVYFIKAEAYQRGMANGDAKQAFINGVLESVKFYYDLNNTANSSQLVAPGRITIYEMPAENTITDYATSMWDAANDKLEVILTQKWLNFGYMQIAQAWNDIRRTGYPALYFAEDGLSQALKTPPSRVTYPPSERSYNTTNYNTQVASMPNGDSYYTKLFWAK